MGELCESTAIEAALSRSGARYAMPRKTPQLKVPRSTSQADQDAKVEVSGLDEHRRVPRVRVRSRVRRMLLCSVCMTLKLIERSLLLH